MSRARRCPRLLLAPDVLPEAFNRRDAARQGAFNLLRSRRIPHGSLEQTLGHGADFGTRGGVERLGVDCSEVTVELADDAIVQDEIVASGERFGVFSTSLPRPTILKKVHKSDSPG